MKNIKKIFVAATLCATVAVGYNAYQQATMTEQERLTLANIEALTSDGESDNNLVPDRYLVVTPYAINVECNTNGSITVAGEKFSGNYEKGKTYSILYQI